MEPGEYVTVTPHPALRHQHGVQVDLTPLGVFVLLRRPTAELTGAVPALDELGDPGLAALPGRLADAPDWPRRFARVEAFLAGRLLADRVRTPDPEVAWAWQTLVRRAGAVGIAELAVETGWSRRHLLDRFRAQVGPAPKAAARVLRFERAAGLVVGGRIHMTLRYDDPRAALDFLSGTLGLTPGPVMTDPEGDVWCFGTYRPVVP
ncbi:helix-turn-helix domain-containing protein [Pseudonocardia sp. RS11V-5]|uniref:helix-turn-helix domain-containing protein n=1 Tax=Pseudonocardia terrae TaxID=2905831 RepID=UPI001E3D5CA9|nr:helix-turn-helix domain-containing protein [Pseudonocardia terrae]MCE3554764.1 helix-turn-helix domain-containing protein [Pseudonocardia terrae]